MTIDPLAPRFLILYLFLLPAQLVHLRGRVRLRFPRQFADHSTLMAPYNLLMYLFSAVPATPILDARRFHELDALRNNWQTIRDEALGLLDGGRIRAGEKHNDLGFNSFFSKGWKRFYVKWYGEPLPSARAHCPATVALVDALPSVHAAMFALLPPGARLNKHRDPFAGSLRYHLGLATPNSDGCRIFIDGQEYSWRDGDDILFDETYIHWAENTTDETRLILFCDVERPLKTRLMRALNRLVSRYVIPTTATQNVASEPVGALNRAYAALGRWGAAVKRHKGTNKKLFRAVKYLLLTALAALYVLV